MINVIEKDGAYIAIFENLTDSEKKLLDEVKSASGLKPEKKSVFSFNFGSETKKTDSNDYYSSVSKKLTQDNTLKRSDESTPMER